ncbi:aldo/keto reductase [Psychroflexus planctonicus]|uniref:Oxidoreductase n=1 Tax=Psychroflexus planctonicus TaxID=1526575 RepID=A0ABQ1SI34_9FLAO|nr:aldo/keto reductase [Psychroflexus planctonicus]GGE37687.1 oxidoreductase [Psychroflexus planctonicus]
MKQNNKQLKLSTPIQGCMTWGKWGANFSKQAYQQQIESCMASGITTFDHADIYGGYTTEAEFGNALAEMKLKRDSFQLISKCGIQMDSFRTNKVKHYQYDAAYLIRSVEQSLQHLQTDYLDVFLLHRPSPLLDVEEVQSAVQQLLQEGKIKSFGVSNFNMQQLALLQQALQIEYNQIQISITHSESLTNGLLDYMQLHQIQPMAWNPLGNFFKEASAELKNTVQKMAAKYEATEDQILLAWLRKHPSKIIPVVGTTNPKRMQAAKQTNEIKIDVQDWFALLEAARGKQVD